MEENNKKKQPIYTGDGIAIWRFQTKEGKPYVSVKIVGHDYIKAWKVEKPKENE